jgi:hypothetical protein
MLVTRSYVRATRKEKQMRRSYSKPTLRKLGLLRVLTRFSF